MPRHGKQIKRIILGVTGTFGSGKTTVSKIFKKYHAEIIDADKLAHACLKAGGTSYRKIVSLFGAGILRKDKSINRKRLAAVVFNNKSLLKKINSVIHPRVINQINKRIKKSKSSIIVLDAPLLIESGLHKVVDKIIVVTITRKEQINRMTRKGSLKRSDISKRVKAQIPLGLKKPMADFIIDNSGTVVNTKRQVGAIRRKLWKN